ncbi:hypothetical protein [Streptomyces sp. MP131-18]|uniref:hypothetical protein n=1 Tax=Streptomyces sp. MP131-18 TaxID=1857892 RepID=UPI00117C06F3|nr:hypothetical protein [Streptomyces sp. MP131-18]
METFPASPFGFLTLQGEWVAREFWDDNGSQKTADYEARYSQYLASVPDETVVTVVDIHS